MRERSSWKKTAVSFLFSMFFVGAFGFLLYAGISSMAAIQSFNNVINQWIERQKHATLHLSFYLENPGEQAYRDYQNEYEKLVAMESFMKSLRDEKRSEKFMKGSIVVRGFTPDNREEVTLANTVLMPFRERQNIITLWKRMSERTNELNKLAERARNKTASGTWTELDRRRGIKQLDSLSQRFTGDVHALNGRLGALTGQVRSVLLWLTTSVFVLFTGGGGFMLYRYVGRQNYLTCQLKQTLQEKQAMLQEVHHRVKNNLALITGLLTMQVEASRSDEVREEFQDTEERIQSLALTHEMLYQSEQFSDLSFDDFVEKMIHQMRSRYRGVSETLELKIDADPIRLDMHQAVPAALLLNELVSNAFKHGLRLADPPKLHINANEQNEIVTLVVENNGKPMPAHIDPAASQSLGMELIRTLCKQLNGQITYSRPEHTNTGTRAVASFPLSNG